MKVAVVLTLAMLLTGDPADAQPVEGRLTGYIADYNVKYGSLKVGTSRTELRRFRMTDQWIIETQLTASGLGRLFAGGNLLQHSSFQFDEAGLRPLLYRYDDGTRRSERDVELQFDWRAGRVTGVAEGSPVDIPLESGLQDAASAQVFVQLRLRDGVEPGIVPIIEKNRVKYYEYALLRREQLETAIGVVDTVVYRSAREGSTRENFFWLAPELGFAIVQAEQRRDGKRQFQTYISALRSGS